MGQVIGATLTNGFAGMFARQPDSIIDRRFAGAALSFGAPVKYDASGNVVPFGSGDAATAFVGIVGAEVKTSLTYGGNVGSYAVGEAVPVLKRGRINVKNNVGTPALNGDVYIRIAANGAKDQVGGIEASADSTYTIKLTNAKFGGAADANGIVELEIFSAINA